MPFHKSLPIAEEETRKRKRNDDQEELEIDVNLPEPPSRKSLRKSKKQKNTDFKSAIESSNSKDAKKLKSKSKVQSPPPSSEAEQKPKQRSEYGVWIGNLPWTWDRPTLETFFTAHADGKIKSKEITRINMPRPTAIPAGQKITHNNKGFAYVDFASQENLEAALALTETLMGGRRLLIKNSRDFEGRPDGEKSKEHAGANGVHQSSGDKAPNERMFVGNLGFEVTREDLKEHFSQCGEVADVFMASFEDTGKCKGFAWVTFASVQAATAAVRGWINKAEAESESEEEQEDGGNGRKKKKPKKPRKWFVNKLHGRILRCEFAEDAPTRYNKRFGRGAKNRRASPDYEVGGDANGDGDATQGAEAVPPEAPEQQETPQEKPRSFTKERKKPRKEKRDPRTIKPGAAHASAPRAAGAIVKPQGKKIVFD